MRSAADTIQRMGAIREHAEQLLAGRLAAIDDLETNTAVIKDLKQQLKDAETRQATAWSAAIQAGWTSHELDKLDLAQPPIRRGGRPKGSRARRSTLSATAADHATQNTPSPASP
ncbi:hypothetical protein BKA23_3396 [Rudaeicoccus suwonensis]|uniref:Uncharacterized protein n=1 Tax=Rudaeicoccus suwonensis TaxID=657409 RepID=A0A561DVK1_9MICO|nr:hypothetical protein BKA23_3396 [Rudaeicoccus suwonensis]